MTTCSRITGDVKSHMGSGVRPSRWSTSPASAADQNVWITESAPPAPAMSSWNEGSPSWVSVMTVAPVSLSCPLS
jgi:hypothetical protein